MEDGGRTTGPTGAQRLTPTNLRYLDVGIAIWIAAWVAIGIVLAASVRELADLGDTVVAAADGLEETSTGLERVSNGLRETADAFAALGGLPLVGNLGPRLDRAATEVDRIAARVEVAALEARTTGETTREDARDFSVLLGLTVAALGALPSLLMYLLIRPLLVAAAAAVPTEP